MTVRFTAHVSISFNYNRLLRIGQGLKEVLSLDAFASSLDSARDDPEHVEGSLTCSGHGEQAIGIFDANGASNHGAGERDRTVIASLEG